MSEITIPYYSAIPAIICIVGLVVIVFFRQRLFQRDKLLWVSVTVFLAAYLFVVGNATYDDIYYQWDLNRYDLDKDGFFGGLEITADQKAAMHRLTNDAGRNLSFATGFLFALFISVTVYIFGRLRLKVLGK